MAINKFKKQALKIAAAERRKGKNASVIDTGRKGRLRYSVAISKRGLMIEDDRPRRKGLFDDDFFF